MNIQAYNRNVINGNFSPGVIAFGTKVHEQLQEIGGINGITLESREQFGLFLWHSDDDINKEVAELNEKLRKGEINAIDHRTKLTRLSYQKDLYLLPYYLHEEIDPNIHTLYDISGKQLKSLNDMDLDHRFGLLAYGVKLTK